MIYIADKCGLCAGAKRALDITYNTIDKYRDKKVILYKEILHNSYVINKCRSMGCVCVDDINKIHKDDIVIVRAHGETKEFFEKIKLKGAICVDGTCLNVKHVEKIVEESYKKGNKIIIVGKKDHPEVISSNGWCENTAILISTLDEARQLQIDKHFNYTVISQTTYNSLLVNEIYNILKQKDSVNNIEFHDTVCKMQSNMHIEAIKLAEKVDFMFIIGGKDSSNTNSMYVKCANLNKAKCYHISSIEEFESLIENMPEINADKTYGLAGGASTTYEEVIECKKRLERKLGTI